MGAKKRKIEQRSCLESIRDMSGCIPCLILVITIITLIILAFRISWKCCTTFFMIIILVIIFAYLGRKSRKTDDIFEAISRNETTRVNELLTQHPDLLISRIAGTGYPPLHYAIAWNGRPKMIKLLLEHSLSRRTAEPDDLADGDIFFAGESIYIETTPVHLAALRGNIKALELLANHGINLNIRAKDGSTALTFVCIKNIDKAAVLLIEIGADINAADGRGMTPLHYAATRNRLLTKHLIKAGADTGKKNKYGETPLDFAVKKLYLPGIAALLAGGAEWTVTEEKTGELLFEAAKEGEKNLTLALVKKGIDVNIRDKEGKTPLHRCTNRHIAATILLESGALPNIRDNLGNTPLHYATNKNTVKFLIERGADTTIKNNEGKTAVDIMGKTGE